jgi:hypothetical protein
MNDTTNHVARLRLDRIGSTAGRDRTRRDGLEATRPTSGLPEPRGPISERLIDVLSTDPPGGPWRQPVIEPDEDDLHLALYCCYELHYGGFAGVHPDWEWDLSQLELRARLEGAFLDDLTTAAGVRSPCAPGDIAAELWRLATDRAGPSLSEWVSRNGTTGHLGELVVHRSAYQLKEADPHTWAIPRISGAAKATMVAIQADEYGNGDGARTHAALFADTMSSLGLDPTPNRYLDSIPGITLSTTNLISLFGLRRRWRGALVGHLALFEMTSVRPMARYARTLRRLQLPETACRFYDVHVEADREHQHLAVEGMVGGLLADEPSLAADVLFGARALGVVEQRFTGHLLDHWTRGRSSLRAEVPRPELALPGRRVAR